MCKYLYTPISKTIFVLKKCSYINLLVLDTNNGKGVAIKAGLHRAQHNKIILFDGDLELSTNGIKKKIKEHDFVIALDKEGINLDTEKLKSNFENWIASSKDVSFVIGGPDGLSNELIEESNFCWSLSQLTFPHAVVPILVLEQIYRVWSMTQNHPYHR